MHERQHQDISSVHAESGAPRRALIPHMHTHTHTHSERAHTSLQGQRQALRVRRLHHESLSSWYSRVRELAHAGHLDECTHTLPTFRLAPPHPPAAHPSSSLVRCCVVRLRSWPKPKIPIHKPASNKRRQASNPHDGVRPGASIATPSPMVLLPPSSAYAGGLLEAVGGSCCESSSGPPPMASSAAAVENPGARHGWQPAAPSPTTLSAEP